MSKSLLAALTLAAAVSAMSLPAAPPALACGDSEAGGCGENGAADDARWLLKRAVAAVKANEAKALTEFSKGEDGFRTQDLYVFCIGTDGKMTAHPDAGLLGKDAREFQDPTGKHFAAEMLDNAKEGSITEVHYMFPRPGSRVPASKTSFVTRVADQVCGAGYYE